MKVSDVIYNRFIEIVKDKINDIKKPYTYPAKRNIKNSVETKLIKEEVLKRIEEFLKKLNRNNYSVSITYHEKTKTYVIKIIDNETKKVVKEAPLEKILDMIAHVEEIIKEKQMRR